MRQNLNNDPVTFLELDDLKDLSPGDYPRLDTNSIFEVKDRTKNDELIAECKSSAQDNKHLYLIPRTIFEKYFIQLPENFDQIQNLSFCLLKTSHSNLIDKICEGVLCNNCKREGIRIKWVIDLTEVLSLVIGVCDFCGTIKVLLVGNNKDQSFFVVKAFSFDGAKFNFGFC